MKGDSSMAADAFLSHRVCWTKSLADGPLADLRATPLSSIYAFTKNRNHLCKSTFGVMKQPLELQGTAFATTEGFG